MHYTKEELCYIWVDSFIGLEYKNKVQIYNYIAESDGIATALKQAKSEIVQMLNEQDYSLLINSANKQYLDFVIEYFVICQLTKRKYYLPQIAVQKWGGIFVLCLMNCKDKIETLPIDLC